MGVPRDTLPLDDMTGLRAIAILPSGRIVWPMAGGDGTGGASDTDAGDGDQDGAQDDGDKPVDWEQETAKWKALARKHEGESKKNAAAARKLAEVEDADKSESQRLAGQAAEAEKRAQAAEARALRLEVAAAKGLTLAMAGRLQGETQEELEADADELLEALRPATGAGSKPSDTHGGRPREALRSGSAPDAKPEENDPDKLAAMIPRG